MPALDLDLLLGGLKPVIRGLNPQDVNALTNALIQIFQGQGPTLESLFAKTSSFSNALADNSQTVQALIDNLKTVVATISKDGDKFSAAIDKLEKLISGLSQDRDPIGTAIQSLDNGTASLADLLTAARPPLDSAVDQLSRLAPIVDKDKDILDETLRKTPENYRKMTRLGAYGSFYQYYLCGLNLRATDLQGRTVVFPWIKQEGGRCGEQ
jgi:phospholipid/cholesterol/gamma-HCH transport system substrate-binding protein